MTAEGLETVRDLGVDLEAVLGFGVAFFGVAFLGVSFLGVAFFGPGDLLLALAAGLALDLVVEAAPRGVPERVRSGLGLRPAIEEKKRRSEADGGVEGRGMWRREGERVT